MSALDWLLLAVGIVAGLYGSSGTLYRLPETRRSISMSQILSVLGELAGPGEGSLERIPLNKFLSSFGVQGEDDPDVYILQKDDLLLIYTLAHGNEASEERIAIRLSDSTEVIALFFEGSILQKVTANVAELVGGESFHSLRTDLGKVLQLTRAIARKFA